MEPPGASETPQPSPLEGGQAILVVETDAAGCGVLVGDALAGETPLQLMTVRSGTYPVTLRHPDYETARLDEPGASRTVVCCASSGRWSGRPAS